MNQRIKRIQEELEKPLAKAFSGVELDWLPTSDFAAHLAREIVGGTRLASSGKAYPPDQFTVTLHPARAISLISVSETLQSEIGEIVEQVLDEFTYEVISHTNVTLATDPTLNEDGLRIIGWHSSNPLVVAEKMGDKEEHDTQSPPDGAFLVIEGRQHFELRQPYVRIGRRLDNDLVLDDVHVSREHFHLIARNRCYLLEDADSTAGTRVNGELVRKHFLRPGDVISVGNIDLIYGEDTGGPPDVTPPYHPGEEPDVRDQITPLDMSVEQIKLALESPEDEPD